MSAIDPSRGREELEAENVRLREQLAEATQTLEAIQGGAVDALVIDSAEGQRIFSLSGAERPYRLLIEEMREGALTLSADGIVLYGNGALAGLLEVPSEDLTGSLFEQFVAPADRGVFQTLLRGFSRGEVVLSAASAREIPVQLSFANLSEQGESIVGCVITDLTDSEAALAESEERLRLATESAEVGFWDVDVVHDVLFWPPRVKAMFGISVDKPVSMQDFYDGLHPEDRDRTSAAYAAAADPERRALYDVEYRTIGKEDGLVRWVQAKGRGVFDSAGRCLRVIGAAIDITMRKRDEERLRELNETLEMRVAAEVEKRSKTEAALRQSQKMEAVGQLTGGLAHDFNNLLTGISGSLELMHSRINQGRFGDLDRYIGAAQGASKRAAALTHRLLAFSRQQTLDPKPSDVNRLIVGMEELIRRSIGPQVTLDVVTAGGLWSALIDSGQLENALLNLCINARDAMPDGGRITVETANKWLDERAAKERDLNPGQYLSLCVTDTGTGMSAETITRVFDPFFTTKPVGQGTGLGLSMVYGFARQSGGQVRIYSELGQGTTICLYFPRHYGEADEAETLTSQVFETPRAEQGQTVLIVDDEPTIRMLVTEVLEELGYHAIEASDGASGLRVLQSDVRIDLLVTDVGLPGGMNGRQVADVARVNRPYLKVLFITGYAENSVIGHGHLAPGMQVLTKPFVMETLAARIKELVDAQ